MTIHVVEDNRSIITAGAREVYFLTLRVRGVQLQLPPSPPGAQHDHRSSWPSSRRADAEMTADGHAGQLGARTETRLPASFQTFAGGRGGPESGRAGTSHADP